MEQTQPKESRTDRFIDLSVADAAKSAEPPKHSSPAGYDTAWAVKSGACAVLLLASVTYFSFVCKAVLNDYMLLLSPTVKATVPWLVSFGVSAGLLLIMLAVTAVLLRPAWIGLLAYLAAAALFALAIGGGLAAWSAAAVTALFLAMFLLSVAGQLDNQIEFSVHPLIDKRMLLCSLLSLLLAVVFGLGYELDAERRGYVIPPEITAYVEDQSMNFLRQTVDAQKLGPLEKTLVLQQLGDKLKETLVRAEKWVEPYRSYLPLMLGVLAFSVFQMVMIVVGLIVSALFVPIFFILKLARFANVSMEVLPVRRLTLRSVKKTAAVKAAGK